MTPRVPENQRPQTAPLPRRQAPPQTSQSGETPNTAAARDEQTVSGGKGKASALSLDPKGGAGPADNALDPIPFTAQEISQKLGVPLENVEKYGPAIAKAMREAGMTDKNTAIALLATIKAETGIFAPIPEHASGAAYEGRSDLGNTHPGDGMRFKGRGFIQITGRSNYENYGNKLGINLVGNPDAALQPDAAAKILVQYFKDRNVDDMARAGDWRGVRKAVNGGYNGWDTFIGAVNALGGSGGNLPMAANYDPSSGSSSGGGGSSGGGTSGSGGYSGGGSSGGGGAPGSVGSAAPSPSRASAPPPSSSAAPLPTPAPVAPSGRWDAAAVAKVLDVPQSKVDAAWSEIEPMLKGADLTNPFELARVLKEIRDLLDKKEEEAEKKAKEAEEAAKAQQAAAEQAAQGQTPTPPAGPTDGSIPETSPDGTPTPTPTPGTPSTPAAPSVPSAPAAPAAPAAGPGA